MRGSINKKLPFSTLALAVFLIVAAWFLLFFTIPFFVVPAALSNNVVLSSIGKRLIFSAMGFVALLVILARNRVSNRQFWEVFFCYGISWIIISNLGEGLAEFVFAQRDTTSIDTSNALIATLVSYATILGPAIVTLIISRRILFRENNKGAEGNQGDQRASSAETLISPSQENEHSHGPIPSRVVPEEVRLEQASTDRKSKVEDAQEELEKSLGGLNALKQKGVLSDAEFEEAKNRAKEVYEHQNQLAEEAHERQTKLSELRNYKKELQTEFDNSMAELVALNQQGVLDNSAFNNAKKRLLLSFGEKGIESVILYKGIIIEKQGDKFFVDGREYNDVDTAKIYVDFYKNLKGFGGLRLG